MKVQEISTLHTITSYEVRVRDRSKEFNAEDTSTRACRFNKARALEFACVQVRLLRITVGVWFLDRDDIYKPYIFLAPEDDTNE